MSKNSEIKGLGSVSPQSNSSKSLLDTINTGFNNIIIQEDSDIILNLTLQHQHTKNPDSILDNLNTGFDEIEIPEPDFVPELKDDDYTIHICNNCEGEVIVNENIIPNIPIVVNKNNPNEDSVLNSMDSGFGSEQTITTECKRPVYKTHLCKEEYLGEFKSEYEKNLVRTNLDVYSKSETHILIENIKSNIVTKNEIEEIVKDLDYTTSRLNSHASYTIPDNLFN